MTSWGVLTKHAWGLVLWTYCWGGVATATQQGGAVPLPLPAARPTGSLRGRKLDTVGDRTEGWRLESLAPVPHLCGGAAEHLQVPEATAPISVKTVSWAPQTRPLSLGTEAPKQAADGHQELRWRSNGIHTALQIPFKPANTSQKLGSPTGNWNQQGHHSCPWTELKSRRDSRTEDGVPGTTLSSLTGTGGPQGSPRVLSCCCVYSTRDLSWGPPCSPCPRTTCLLPLFEALSEDGVLWFCLGPCQPSPRTGSGTWLGEDWGARGGCSRTPVWLSWLRPGRGGLCCSVMEFHLCVGSPAQVRQKLSNRNWVCLHLLWTHPAAPHFLCGHLHEVVQWGRTQGEGNPGALTPPARRPLLQPPQQHPVSLHNLLGLSGKCLPGGHRERRSQGEEATATLITALVPYPKNSASPDTAPGFQTPGNSSPCRPQPPLQQTCLSCSPVASSLSPESHHHPLSLPSKSHHCPPCPICPPSATTVPHVSSAPRVQPPSPESDP